MLMRADKVIQRRVGPKTAVPAGFRQPISGLSHSHKVQDPVGTPHNINELSHNLAGDRRVCAKLALLTLHESMQNDAIG
jgi:hypothetical protein